jgi:fatty acid desaturase
MQQPNPINRSRETTLAAMLTVLAAAGFLFFLMMLTGGWVIYLILVVLGIIGFGGLHYLLWGRLMMEETAGEREEAEFRAKLELNEWDLPESDRAPPH